MPEPSGLERDAVIALHSVPQEFLELHNSVRKHGPLPLDISFEPFNIFVRQSGIYPHAREVLRVGRLVKHQTDVSPFFGLRRGKQQVNSTTAEHNLANLDRPLPEEIRRASCRVGMQSPVMPVLRTATV